MVSDMHGTWKYDQNKNEVYSTSNESKKYNCWEINNDQKETFLEKIHWLSRVKVTGIDNKEHCYLIRPTIKDRLLDRMQRIFTTTHNKENKEIEIVQNLSPKSKENKEIEIVQNLSPKSIENANNLLKLCQSMNTEIIDAKISNKEQFSSICNQWCNDIKTMQQDQWVTDPVTIDETKIFLRRNKDDSVDEGDMWDIIIRSPGLQQNEYCFAYIHKSLQEENTLTEHIEKITYNQEEKLYAIVNPDEDITYSMDHNGNCPEGHNQHPSLTLDTVQKLTS